MRFHATIGKLQTTLRAVPIARQMSTTEPFDRVKVNVVLMPGSFFSIVSRNKRVNCPTPHCISGPASKNSARYRELDVILQSPVSFLRAFEAKPIPVRIFTGNRAGHENISVSHTFRTLA